MKFNSPEFALLFILIPLIAWYKIAVSQRAKKGGIRFPLGFMTANLKPGIKARFLFVPDLIRLAIMVLLVFALMQPQSGMEQETVNRQGIDIMIALDVSGSMAAEDFKPNRIKAAQRITENFITGIQDHRIGLVVFAGLALTQCPLTMDYGVVTELLRRTSLQMLKYDGTAIGDAIVNGIYKFGEVKKDKRDRVIILLSDGENNSGVDPLEAAKIASDKGIKVYTIGVGSLEGAPIPVIQHGRKVYARNRDGSLYIPKIDEQLLKDVAFLTGGAYFRATDNSALEEIFRTIATLERGKIDVSRTIQYSEKFYWFLGAAFALLVVELFLRSRVFQRIF